MRLIQWYADFYNALQKLDAPAAVSEIGVFALLIGTSAMLYLVGQYLRKIVQLRWRRRLTDVLLDAWTANGPTGFSIRASAAAARSTIPTSASRRTANIFWPPCSADEGVRTGVLDFTMKLIGLLLVRGAALAAFDLRLPSDCSAIDFTFRNICSGWRRSTWLSRHSLTHALGRQLPGLLVEEQKREADFRFRFDAHVRENSSADRAARAARLPSGASSRDGSRTSSSIWYRVIRREFIYGLFQRPYFQTVLRIPDVPGAAGLPRRKESRSAD